MTCPRTVEAGAYVLGALPPAQRLDYHQHLATCAFCRAEVAELAALPGLLGRLDASAAAELEETPAPPRSLLPATLQRLRERRRRQRWRLALVAAAVVLLALAGVGTAFWRTGPTPTTAPLAITLNPMHAVGADGPVQAQIALVPEDGGTRIEMHCVYLDDDATPGSPTPGSTAPAGKPWRLTLLVYPKGGGEPATALATWTAQPGTDISVSARSPLPPDQIDHLVLRRGDSTTLLTYPVA